MHVVCTFSIYAYLWREDFCYIEEVRNYGKVLLIKNFVENGCRGMHPQFPISLPGSAPASEHLLRSCFSVYYKYVYKGINLQITAKRENGAFIRHGLISALTSLNCCYFNVVTKRLNLMIKKLAASASLQLKEWLMDCQN